MNIIDALNHGIEVTIKNTNELLQNKDFDKIIKMFDRFISCVNSKNINRIMNYSIYDFFSMFVIARNYDYDNYKIDNIVTDLEKYRGLINSWGTNQEYMLNVPKLVICLENDSNFEENPKYKTILQSLGLSPEITKYKMVGAFKATEILLQFQTLYKEKTADLQSKILSQQVLERLEAVTDFCRRYRDDVKEDKNDYTKFYQNRIKCTKELKNSLETQSITEMTTVTDDWYEFLHPTVLTLVYPIVNMNLEEYYKYVNEAVETVEKAVNRTPLVKFMYSEHLDPDSIPEDIHNNLIDTNIDIIINNYNLLKRLGIEPYEVFLKYSELLKTIDQETVTKLTYLAEKKILNKYTIIQNPEKLLNNVSTISINYEILKDVIDFDNMNYNGDILFLNPNEIKRRLSILAEYKLIKSNFIFLLCNIEYLGIIDLIIENEIPEQLLIPVCYSSSPLDTIKRIRLYTELNIPYLSPTNSLISEVTDYKKANCTNEDLNEFYPDNIKSDIYKKIVGTTITDIKEEELVKQLDNEYQIDNLYLISSKPISRPKVLRNLQYIKDNNLNIKDNLLLALISNSIINDAEIYELKQKINEKNHTLL